MKTVVVLLVTVGGLLATSCCDAQNFQPQPFFPTPPGAYIQPEINLILEEAATGQVGNRDKAMGVLDWDSLNRADQCGGLVKACGCCGYVYSGYLMVQCIAVCYFGVPHS